MKTEEPTQASGNDQAEASRANAKGDNPAGKCVDDFAPTGELDGKTDSGPEPDVFGREIPPQD